MNKTIQQIAGTLTVGIATLALVSTTLAAEKKGKAEGKANPIKVAMQKYHKAPKGKDPACKKASSGTASKEEIKGMLAAYQAMAKAKPPQGDAASWQTKAAALVAATEALDKGDAGAVDKYKAAVNCKACHDAHRPAAKK